LGWRRCGWHLAGTHAVSRVIHAVPRVVPVPRVAPVSGIAVHVAVEAAHVDPAETVAALVVDDPDVHHRRFVERPAGRALATRGRETRERALVVDAHVRMVVPRRSPQGRCPQLRVTPRDDADTSTTATVGMAVRASAWWRHTGVWPRGRSSSARRLNLPWSPRACGQVWSPCIATSGCPMARPGSRSAISLPSGAMGVRACIPSVRSSRTGACARRFLGRHPKAGTSAETPAASSMPCPVPKTTNCASVRRPGRSPAMRRLGPRSEPSSRGPRSAG
jgi:hypothetical protein